MVRIYNGQQILTFHYLLHQNYVLIIDFTALILNMSSIFSSTCSFQEIQKLVLTEYRIYKKHIVNSKLQRYSSKRKSEDFSKTEGDRKNSSSFSESASKYL